MSLTRAKMSSLKDKLYGEKEPTKVGKKVKRVGGKPTKKVAKKKKK